MSLRNYIVGDKVEGFDPLPTGTYKAELVEMMEKNSTEAGDYIEAHWRIYYPEELSHRSIWEKFYLTHPDPEAQDRAQKKYNLFCKELADLEEGQTLDWDKILYQKRVLKVYSGNFKGRDYTKVNHRLPESSYEEEIAKDLAKTRGQKSVSIKQKASVSSKASVDPELNDAIPF